MTHAADPPDAEHAKHAHERHPTRTEEIKRAAANAFRLGSSLILTWTIAIIVRIFVPRHFGPELFGSYNLADSVTITGFTLLALGVDQHIQNTVSVDRKAANEYLGPITVLRVCMSVFLFAAVGLYLYLNGRSILVQKVAAILGVGYLFNAMTGSYAAILMACGSVGRMSAINIAAKLVWGGGSALVLLLHGTIEGLAITFAVTELVRMLAFRHLTKSEADYHFRWDIPGARKALRMSMPFYLNGVAIVVYGKIDAITMGILTNDAEIGWYGSATNLAGLALLLAPVSQWALGPMMARAAKANPDELWLIVRRMSEGVFVLSIPIALSLALGADVIVRVLGGSFVPAAPALRVLAPMFVFTYIAMTTAVALGMVGRGWTVTAISVGALFVNPAVNCLSIPYFSQRLGPGGAGVGAAITLVTGEALVTFALCAVVGRASVDRRLVLALAKSLVAVAVTLVVDHLAAGLGPLRLLPDALAYLASAALLRVVSVRDIVALIRHVRSPKTPAAAA